jgi:DNA-directed RNA polymerase specialized sigma24 family protein
MAAALLARSRYRADQGSAIAWLFGIAHHVFLMSRRRGRAAAVVPTRYPLRLG